MLIFTNDDYRRIQAWLKKNAIKDSDFAISQETVPEEDILVITLNMATVPTNYKIKIKDLLNSSLGKVVINSIIAKSVKVNNLLTVDASNIKLDNKKGVTLQNVLDYFDDNKLNRHTDDILDGNLTIKKNITIEGNIKSNDGTTTIEADLKATGEITDGNDNILSDVNDAAKQWSLEYQDPQQDEPTVRAKYVLKDYKGVPKGNTIKVYKDSAITNVYLGTTEDICDENTGEVTKKPIQNNNEALSIVYRLDTGKYSLVNVPIGIFIKEAEFDKYRGLGITENGQVFIKLANDVESSNYLHFNDSGEVSADGIENRILQDLGTIINSVAGDGTMWGQYKKEEGTKDSPTNEASRWGQYKQAEADRNERLNNLENKIEEEKTAIIDTNRIANGAVTIPKLSADIQALIANLSKNYVFAGIATPITNPETPDGPVFYLATEAGTYANFNGISVADGEVAILEWKDGWTKKTTGLATEQEIIYDVSARNGGVVFESLSALLSSSNLSTLIPTSVRHGGMSIRFIQGSVPSSDNKYVQYRLMTDSWSTVVTDWQGVDDEPTVNSENLVKSGGVANKLAEVEGDFYDNNIERGIFRINGWDSYTSQIIESNIFGSKREVYKVDFKNHSGNTLGFEFYFHDSIEAGTIINIAAAIFSPKAATYTLSIYNSTRVILKWLSSNTIQLKQGINKIMLSLKSESVLPSSSTTQLYFRDVSLAGETMYVYGYTFAGENTHSINFDLKDKIENAIISTRTELLGDFVEVVDVAGDEVEDYEFIGLWSKNTIGINDTPDYTADFLDTKKYRNNTQLPVEIIIEDHGLFVNSIYYQYRIFDEKNNFVKGHKSEENKLVYRRIVLPAGYTIIISGRKNTTGQLIYLNPFYKEKAQYSEIDYNKVINLPKINNIEVKGAKSLEDFGIDNLPKTTYIVWRDITKNLPLSNIKFAATTPTNVIREERSDGTYVKATNSAASNYNWFGLGITVPQNFIFGHKYFIAINFELINDSKAPTSGSTQGNMNYASLDFRINFNAGDVISSSTKVINSIVTKGNSADLKFIVEMKESGSDGKDVRLQLGNYNKEGETCEFIVHSVCLIDMTALNIENQSDVEQLFAKYRYNHSDIIDSLYHIKVDSAKEADTAGEGAKPDVEIWGDSLVAQGYGTNYLAPLINRTVITKGYGGKTSTYIRDKFLAESDKNRSIIINVGRNNYFEPDVIIQDIRIMVEAIPHNRFLICTPPNGNYGEGKETSAYSHFIKIRDRLALQYPANFLDTRGATIQDYNMGNVKLIDSFVQPSIGENITIHVSDASFLVTYNANDVTKWGDSFMKRIVIGKTIDNVDTYKVLSSDISANTLTVQLEENKSGIAPGSTVANGTDDGGISSIKYLRVLQYADYYCWSIDTTQSTFRQDGIHMSKRGQQCIAKIIGRKVEQMNL